MLPQLHLNRTTYRASEITVITTIRVTSGVVNKIRINKANEALNF
jgi:uncharacterized protein (UPF0333 family)